MIDLTKWSDLTGIAAAITTVGGAAWYGIKKLFKSAERKRTLHKAEILQVAKEGDAVLKLKLESKINELELQLQVLRENVEKDMAHLKDTYNGELKFLGQKIDDLRQEVHSQHGQLVALLMKMIDK